MTTVIITRPKISIKQSTDVYKRAGFDVFQAPCFDFITNDSIQAEWLKAPADVWIVLSVHALKHALLIAPELKPEKDTQVIAVGPAVEKAWQKQFSHPISSHPLMNSEGVIELLKADKPNSVKILTTRGGRNLIKQHCMNECISYAQFNTYKRLPSAIDQEGLIEWYQNPDIKPLVLTLTSSGILKQFMAHLAKELNETVLSNPVVVGAQRIADLAEELGFLDIYLAENPSDESMCAAVSSMI